MPFLDPRTYGELGRELRKRPFRMQLLFCWAIGIFWIATALLVQATRVWALALGILFLIVPFVSRARQRRGLS